MASAVVLSMVLVGCGSSSKKNTKKPEIALITDSGGINDKSFNQSAWEAVKEYGTKMIRVISIINLLHSILLVIRIRSRTLLTMVQKSLFYQVSNLLLHQVQSRIKKNTRVLSSLRSTSHLLMKKITLQMLQIMFTAQLIKNSSQVIQLVMLL